KAGHYQVKITNTSSIPHDIVFSNGVQLAVAPGQQASTTLDIPDSGLSYFCSLPGHKEAGMVGSITVSSESPQANNTDPEKTITTHPPYDPEVPPLTPFTQHDIYLIAEEKLNTVAKGVSQQLW